MSVAEVEERHVEKANSDEIKGDKIDHYLEMVNPPNRPGRYQLLQLAILCAIWTVPLMGNVAGIYDAYSPPHHCTVDNISQIPEKFDSMQNRMKANPCEMYANWTELDAANRSAAVVPCQHGWTYDRSQYEETFISEFDLVCDHSVYFETMRTVAGIITIPATLIVGYLADRFGRRKVFIITYMVDRVVSIMFASVRLLALLPVLAGIAALSAGEVLPVFIAYELFPAKYRGSLAIGCNIVRVVSTSLVPLMGNFIRQWRMLRLTLTGIATAVGLILFWFVTESPTWLISQHRYTEAENLLRKIAKFNKIKLPETTIIEKQYLLQEQDAISGGTLQSTARVTSESASRGQVRGKLDCCRPRDKVEDREQSEQPQGAEVQHGQRFSDLLKSRRMRIITLIVSGLFLVNALVYSGLFFLASYLPGNIHLNNFLMIVVELPSYFVALLVMPRLGRKWMAIAFLTVAGVGLLASAIEITEFGQQHPWIALVTALIGKVGIAGSYAVVYLYGPELFPTSLRTLGFSTCRVSEMAAQIMLPYASMYLVKIASWLPRVLFGGLAILISIPILFLPETKGRALPETIQEIESWR